MDAAIETNPVLEIAKKLGYKADFDGEGAKTPEEFILYSKEIEKNQRGKIKDLIGKVDTMSSEFTKTQETFAKTIDSQNARHTAELKKAKEKLEKDFDDAVDEADTPRARQIQQEIKEIEKQEVAPKTTTLKTDPNQEYFENWRQKNIWIDTDKKAQAEFKKAHIDLLTEHGEGKGAEFELAYIEKKLKAKMPEKFGLKKKEDPPAGDVGEGKNNVEIGKAINISSLTSEEKAMFNSQKKAFGKHFNEKSSLAAIAAVRAAKKGAK